MPDIDPYSSRPGTDPDSYPASDQHVGTPLRSVGIEHLRGSAREFHAREVPLDGAVHIWWFETIQDALVLGSMQDFDLVDHEECRRANVEVVRRRSGGGLVFLSPSGTLWLDVVIPREHPVWDGDVTTSTGWLGEVWIEALASTGLEGLVQHSGRWERSALSELICFAGRGPGEIFLASGEKIVGISQRRTRDHARFQCAVSLRWEPERFLHLLKSPRPDVVQIASAGSTLELNPRSLVTAMSDGLTRRLTR